MGGNYIKLAFRSLFSRKGNTLINIAGLAVGSAVCLVIFLVIKFELSFENYHFKMYRLAAALAIFLSCLGLYGLTSFMITERTKEAGIRKVLGAKIGQIVYLFSREFILLIAVAFAIVSPLAWYFMSRWLENYTYHTDISASVFITGGLMAMLIALATIGYQTIKIALANPVNSLRTE